MMDKTEYSICLFLGLVMLYSFRRQRPLYLYNSQNMSMAEKRFIIKSCQWQILD